jgi:hypothetical protein
MEVLLAVPIVLIMGVFLIYLSVSQDQAPRPVPVSVKEAVLKDQDPPQLSKPQPVKAMASRTARGLTQADVLLADVLSELLEMREEGAALRTKVEKLSEDVEALKNAVQAMKRPARKAS